MIKICSPQLGLSPFSVLGGEVYDYQTIKGFCEKKFKVFVYLPKNRPFDKKIKNLTVNYCLLTHIVPPWIYSFLMLPYLFKLYKEKRFQVLRIHSPRFLGVGAFVFHLFYPEVPILSSAVTVDSSGFFYPIEKWVYQNSAAIIVQSRYMKNVLVKKYGIINKEKIYVTFGGQIDQPREYKKIPKQAKLIKHTDRVLVFMGALIERKNPQFALEVFIELNKTIPQSKMVFIGKGSQKSVLLKLIKKAKLDKEVIFIDQAIGEEKAYWFSRMDLFLFPSLDEGFGLVVTEAMSFNKIVIASNKAAFPEIITNGVDGFSIQLNKSIWLKTAIKVLNDKKLFKTIGQKAGNKVRQQFNWQRTYNLNAQIVKHII